MSFAVNRLARTGLFSAVFSGLIFLSACGGGGGSQSPSGSGNGGGNPPPPSGDSVPKVSLSGGGVKGPLAYAPLAFYEFNANSANFQAATPVATGVTDSHAAFSGVLVPAPNPPYILVFTTNDGTTVDLTTGQSPVITTMKTVVTQDMLSQGYPIYATPLTTLAVDIAIANTERSLPAQTVDNFLAALPLAARQVTSSLGFGVSSAVDIFRTWPVVGTDGSAETLRITAEYRSAVEAFSTLVYDMAQSAGSTTGQIMQALAADLGDGVIDGTDAAGQSIAVLSPTELALLTNADPANLTITNSTTKVGDVESLLATEAAVIGATADTTLLADGTIQVTVLPAELNPDRDGDDVLNVDDAFPDDPARDTDTDGDGLNDGDGLADVVWTLDGNVRTGVFVNEDTDDDNDGLTDADEAILGTDPLLADSDGDGASDFVENTIGTNPLLADSDGDGVLDGVEIAGAGTTVVITGGANAGTYTGTGTDPVNPDSDGDGLNDGAEVEALSNPLVSDTDGDGLLDGADNCPAVANADQLDINPADGVGDACSADLTGVWKLSFQPTAMIWNGCDNALLGKSYTVYQSMTQDAGGNLAATDHRGLGMSGTLTVGTNRFDLAGAGSGVVAQSGAPTDRTVSLSARKNLDGSVTGSYVILDKISGTAVCEESGAVSASLVYQHSVGEATYSGLYALEYVDNALPLRGAETTAKLNSGMVQVAVSGTAFAMQEYRAGGSSVVSSGYDPDTGVFHESTLHEEAVDLNADGITDLHRVTSDLTGIMVRAADVASGAVMVFARTVDDATYFNISAYDPAVTPNFQVTQRLDGYGRPVATSAFNETLTRPNADGTLAKVDRLGLANPPLWKATAASTLRFEAYVGTDTSVAPVCSAPFDSGLSLVENYPAADAVAEALRSGDYGYVACEAGAEGSVSSGTDYTLVVKDDNGVVIDSFALTALATGPAPAAIPSRRDARMDGAGSPQTQIDPSIAIDGYFNPYVAHTLTWPDQGANGYQLRLREVSAEAGDMPAKETRLVSATNSVDLPAGVLSDTAFTRFEVLARYEPSTWAVGQTLTVFPFMNGIFNVETRDPVSGQELNFQLALQRTYYESALCSVTYSNQPLACFDYHLVVDWNNDRVSLLFDDPTDPYDAGFYLTFEFSDAEHAIVTAPSPNVPWVGTARRVTTELVARNQVLADGTQSTVLTLENPPPLFAAGQLAGASGTEDLDGLGSTLLSLWDDTAVDPAAHFAAVRKGFWEYAASATALPAVVTQLEFDSAASTGSSYTLPDGGYRVSFQGHESEAMADAVFAVDAVAASTDAVRGPVMAGININGTPAGTGVGDTAATAVAVSAKSDFDLSWEAMADPGAKWAIVVRAVDGTGQPIPDREWRTPFMDPATDAPLIFTLPGSWSWTNGASLDLANHLATGEAAQIQLISRNADGSLQGLSDPIFVRR